MKTNNILRILKQSIISIFLFFIVLVSLDASNYVTVATIGNKLPEFDQTDNMQEVVDLVKEFWLEELNQVLPYKPDLIVLPEFCDNPRGLSQSELSEYYRIRQNQVIDFFSEMADRNDCYIAFGTKRKQENGEWRNSVIMLDRQGDVVGIYNKNYPTIGEMENGIVPGENIPVFECDFGTVAAAICFDLNFTELCQKYAAKKPDLIVFPSAYHGGIMQSHWAYQCRAYFVGSIKSRNTPSEIRNPLGEVVAKSTNYFDFAVSTINLDNYVVHLDYNWDKLIALKAKYGEGVSITDPGELGAVLITSEINGVSAQNMVDEFNLELLDEYFDRSRKFRKNKLHTDELTK